MEQCFIWLRDLDTNQQVLDRIGEKRALLNNILHRKANWIEHNLEINCLLHDVIKGEMTEVKGVGRRTQLLDELRNRRYWELKEEAEDQKKMKMIVYHSNKRKYLP